MSLRSCPDSSRGFTLVELLIAMLVVALLAAGLAVPLAARLEMQRLAETRRRLEEAREALLGFAAAHGRLPCPATAASRGEESFAPGGDAANGRCASFHDGFLPAAALGLGPLDEDGFLRDAWSAAPANRVRYAVFGAEPVNAIEHPLTRAGGLAAATLAGLGAAPRYLLVCASGAAVTPSSCGPAANQLTRRAILVLHSRGANGAQDPSPASDEARNLDGNPVFVTAGDDVLTWVPLPILVSRMLAAGRIP